ncbi:MAG: hypothetical protein KBC36_11095 [Spirochaetia bacterium]|nr:hypothetical protein [Spirochaetia bacterium]
MFVLISLAAVRATAQAWPPLPGDLPLARAPDSARVRAARWEDFLNAPRDAALAMKPRVVSESGRSWELRVERDREHFYMLVLPRRGDSYPVYAQGSWILKRRMSDGAPVSAKVFLRSDPGTFARLTPDGGRTRLDVVAYGGMLRLGVPLPMAFERAMTSPLPSLVELSAELVEWELFSPEPSLYRELASVVAGIRAALPNLAYADDGALDSDGAWVRLADGAPQTGAVPGLNCSGFAKWVVDGLLGPARGSLSSVAEIKALMSGMGEGPAARGASLTRAYETALEPYYGLDFTRALGALAADALGGRGASTAPPSMDVLVSPPALLVDAGNPVNGLSGFEAYPDRFPDAGYRVDGLAPLLFMLASREPGHAYLAAISRSDPKAAGVRRWYHVAVLVPWFDSGGVFRVAVFESAAETSLGALVARAGADFAHLVRLPIAVRFEPPLPESAVPAVALRPDAD